jgi:RimJ/RimL family protein N-acetyltransferase
VRLLVLDTEKGGPGEQLYARIGYSRVGEIPEFAQIRDGAYCATVFFYRLL